MEIETFASVWDAIEDTPAEAEIMRLRSSLMLALQRDVKVRKLTHAKGAQLFGVSRARLTDLMRGKIDLFDLEALVGMMAKAGLRLELRIAYPRRVYATGETPNSIADLFAEALDRLAEDDKV